MTQSSNPFLWGVSTASYQIEGAAREDGRGDSVWDAFCRQAGKVKAGDTGDVACDHYHRWEADLDLMASLGIQSYRFSIAWPRVFPAGRGTANPAGLDFYDRLVDGMLKRGITPMATCYHWDLPQTLEAEGGWRVRGTAEAFADYAALLARRLGDRIPLWCTLNEPFCAWWLGYGIGLHAPGARETGQVIWQTLHNMLLGHGLAVSAMRASSPRPIKIGMAYNPVGDGPDHVNPGQATLPFFESADHIAAARAKFRYDNEMMLDPLLQGAYPAERFAALGGSAPAVREGDLKAIAAPLDFFGLNLYFNSGLEHAGRGFIPYEPHFPRTDFDWPIVPDAIYWTLRFIHELYKPGPLYITENGCCWPDGPDANGRVEDAARIVFLRQYIAAVQRALAEGIPVDGYFLWSFMDNFEWQEGYGKRFGIVHVDYKTQKRTPKASAEWYSALIRNGGKLNSPYGE